MAIITISCELGALGEEVARKLRQISGSKIIGGGFIQKELAARGFRKEEQRLYDEGALRFLPVAWPKRIRYLHLLKLILCNASAHGNCIIVGYGGSAVFKGVANHIAVGVVAPMAVRIERVMKLLACDVKAAKRAIRRSNRALKDFHRVLYRIDWQDPCEYELTISTGKTSTAQAAEAINDFRIRALREDDESTGKAQLSDMLLSNKVLTEITCARDLRISNLSVRARNGIVRLEGVSCSTSTADKAVEGARTIPGVRDVINAIRLVRRLTYAELLDPGFSSVLEG